MDHLLTVYGGPVTAVMFMLGTVLRALIDAARVRNEAVTVKSNAVTAYDIALQASVNNVTSLQKRVDALCDDLRALRELTAIDEAKHHAEIADLRAIVCGQTAQIETMTATHLIKCAEIAELKTALVTCRNIRDQLAAAATIPFCEQVTPDTAQNTTPDSSVEPGASGG